MLILSRCLSFLLFFQSFSLYAHDFFIPAGFEAGEIIEQLILISDVDGVVRHNVESGADPRIIDAVQQLLKKGDVDVTFLSGTPVSNDLTVEEWRRGNIDLDAVFQDYFAHEMGADRVAIYGLLGSHKMRKDRSVEIVDSYSLAILFETSRLMLNTFLKQVISESNAQQQQIAVTLQDDLKKLMLQDDSQSLGVTPREFAAIALAIRKKIDPQFRLLCNCTTLEMQFNPNWTLSGLLASLQTEVTQPAYEISTLSPAKRVVVSGSAQRDGEEFHFVTISKTHKGVASSNQIQAKTHGKSHRSLIVTLGDTQGDYPMHENAHIGFHVGKEQVWKDNAVAQPQCVLVRGENGEDRQHLNGTLKVVKLLADAVGKPFHDFKYIPRPDAAGQWDFYSIRDLRDCPK